MNFLNAVHVFPDGRVSDSVGEVRVMMAQLINKRVNSTLDGANRPHFMSELLRGFGAYKVSGHLTKQAVGGEQHVGMIVISTGMWTPGSAVMVMWPSVDLIYDPYTNAAKREVALTMSTLWNFTRLRNDPWKNYYVEVAAGD